MKKNLLWIALNSIFIIIFNLFFFWVGGTQHVMSVWLSYGFIHLVYFLLLTTTFFTRKGKSSAFLGLSLSTISAGYFLLEFLIGLAFIFISAESIKVALLVQVCIAAIYAVILIVNILANEHTADEEDKRQYEIDYVKRASIQLKGILNRIQDKESKKKVERVYDALYSSPTKSHPTLAQIETNIFQSINELENFVSVGDSDTIILLADSLLKVVNERNMHLKTFN